MSCASRCRDTVTPLAVGLLMACGARSAESPPALLPRPGGVVTGQSAQDQPLELRFCPRTAVRSYPLDSQHGIETVVLQNAAIINHGAEPVAVSAVDFDLLQKGEARESRRLVGEELKRGAAVGPSLQAGGLFALLAPLQFCGKALIADGVRLGGPTLAPGEALLLMYQPLVFTGVRDALRVTVHAERGAHPFDASGSLPVLSGFAKTEFRFPLAGTSFVAVGPTPHTGHRWAVPEEFALDIAKLGEGGGTHRGLGLEFRDYYGYGADVLAAADGDVVEVARDLPEDASALRRAGETDLGYASRVQDAQFALLQKGGGAALGDHVVLRHTDSEFSVYAHLAPGSVSVSRGDRVRGGQPIGKLGSSGNSTEPHLHFQVCDGPDAMSCSGTPVRFTHVRLPYADLPRPIQSGDVVVAE